MRFSGVVLLVAISASCSREPTEQSKVATTGYVDPKTCATCHAAQAKTYAATGMGQSFRQATAGAVFQMVGDKTTYFHAPSDRHYEILKRGDQAVMRRYQKAADGAEMNVLEESIDYVVGSGHHAHTFLHRGADNRLAQLPVSWYAEKGGSLAMSPGYDSPAHQGFRRKIAGDCFACHNAIPLSGQGADGVFPADLPQGIDCQRCHGPGQEHVTAAQAAQPPEKIRKAVVNPARLPKDRQLEVCLQCHLETTSFELPNALFREGHNAFSYRPGQPLGEHQLHFDHAAGTGHEDKFEIAGAAYRLRQSACFLKSGTLTCTTCHNPHQIPRGEAAATYYTAKCRTCHGDTFQAKVAAKQHTADTGCVTCHMPKRRTEDVVHVVMTDHLIQRRKPAGDLLAARAERHLNATEGYRGAVVLYYPAKAEQSDHNLALAQVAQGTNLAAGIAQLEKHPGNYIDLAAAYSTSNQLEKALAAYQKAPKDSLATLKGLGSTFLRAGDASKALEALNKAANLEPDAGTQAELGRAHYTLGHLEEAIKAMQTAVNLDPDLTEARDALGNMLAERGDLAGAERELKEAIRRQPDFASAYSNLAKVQFAQGAGEAGAQSYQRAIALQPTNAAARYGYGIALASAGRWPQAEAQVSAAIAADPSFAEAQETMGSLYARRGAWAQAAECYRKALKSKPQFGRAHLGLGTALAASRDLAGARAHLQQAVQDADPAVRQEAAEILGSLP